MLSSVIQPSIRVAQPALTTILIIRVSAPATALPINNIIRSSHRIPSLIRRRRRLPDAPQSSRKPFKHLDASFGRLGSLLPLLGFPLGLPQLLTQRAHVRVFLGLYLAPQLGCLVRLGLQLPLEFADV